MSEHDTTPRWFGETGYPDDHPSQLMADISQACEETTSDVSILLDAAWTKDLTLVNSGWREAQAVQLEREAEQIALLLRNAAIVLRTLRFEPPSYTVEIAPESTGNPEVDEGERMARSRLIEVLEAGANPEADVVYRWLSDRVMELKQEEESR